jgi:hypothetical protein
MPTILSPAERRWWFRWVLLTTLGSLFGGAVSGALESLGETRFDDVTSPLLGALVLLVTTAVPFGVQGAAIGLAQGIALRHVLARSGWWVIATGGGWAIGGAISGSLAGSVGGAVTGVGPDAGWVGFVITFTGSGIALLFLPGIFQWLVLRRQVERAGWWVLASAGTLFVANGLAFLVMVVIARALGWGLPSAPAWGLSGLLAGLLGGALTGAVLVRLLRQPVAAVAEEEGTGQGSAEGVHSS